MRRVDELLGILGLESCANVRVGSSLVRGISGGQSRRLSVGIGMIDLANTRLVLMDEPTTVRITSPVACSQRVEDASPRCSLI